MRALLFVPSLTSNRYAVTAASAWSPDGTLANSSQPSPESWLRKIVPSPRPAYSVPGASGSALSAQGKAVSPSRTASHRPSATRR